MMVEYGLAMEILEPTNKANMDKHDITYRHIKNHGVF